MTLTIADYDFSAPLPHPGEILREDYMAPMGISAGALAKLMGLKDRTRIERLVREAQPITPDTALRLERAFGAPALFWMNLQAQHDLSKLLMEQKDRFLEIHPIVPKAG